MTDNAAYLVVVCGSEGPVDCFGPVLAMDAEAATKEALGSLAGMSFGPFSIKAYPVAMDSNGDVECEDVDPEVLEA